MLDALMQHIANLLFVTGISLIAIGLGNVILCKISTRHGSFGECVVFSAGLGFGVLSYSVFALAVLQLLSSAAMYVLMGLSAALAFVGWFKLKCSVNRKPILQAGLSSWDLCIGAILSACVFMGLLLVLTPAVGKDALIYHLAVPKLFLGHGGTYFIPGNIFAHYPLNAEMLYVLGLALRGEVLAKAIHFVIGLFILLGMWQFARHHVSETSFMLLALLVFYTIPSVFVTSHMAYSDLVVTFYAFLAVYAFVNWFGRRQHAWLVLCGILSGLAISTKYTALLLPFLGCLGILWGCRNHKEKARHALWLVLVYVACALIVGSPFYVKNWVMTGNPFYPFLYAVFDGRGWDPEQARLYDMFVSSLGKGRGFWDYLLLPWNVSMNARMHSAQFDGILGPAFILTLPFAIGMRKVAVGAKIAMAYCLLTFMFWASSAQQIRYLIPVFPFLAVMIGYVLSYYRKQTAVFGVLVVLLVGSLGFNGYHVVDDFRKVGPVGVVTGREDKNSFLDRMIPSYAMFNYINSNLPDDSKLFLIYMRNLGYLCDRPYYSDSMFESYSIQKILGQSETPADVHDALKEGGFTHMVYDINYIVGEISSFSVRQKDLFSAFQNRYLKLIRTEKARYYLFKLAG